MHANHSSGQNTPIKVRRPWHITAQHARGRCAQIVIGDPELVQRHNDRRLTKEVGTTIAQSDRHQFGVCDCKTEAESG